jgi:hypothetical protein
VAVSAETSSAAAGITPVVGGAAAEFWALIVEPIPVKLTTAAARASGWVVTNESVFFSIGVQCGSLGTTGDPLYRLGFGFDPIGKADSARNTALNDPWSVE